MAGTKELKTRIHSVQDTGKITNAMYLIASTKLRKAKAQLDQTRPYFEAVRHEIAWIFSTAGAVKSRYVDPDDQKPLQAGTCACLVVTADKGLAGMYNQNVIREVEKRMAEHPDTRLFVVGEYGRQYFARHRIPVERSFLYTAQNPTMHRAREICEALLAPYDQGQVQTIDVIYTDMKNGMTEEVRTERLLPFSRQAFAMVPADTGGAASYESGSASAFEFVPSAEAVLDTIIPNYVSGYIYSVLVDGFCSEQSARMTAMNAAGQNAQQILSNLRTEYNRLRQAAITQEITEISSGAKAQKQRIRRKQQEEVRRQ